MASHAFDFGRASALPLSAVLASIPSYPRPVIERLVARLIDHMDEQDGVPNEEANGDEREDCEGQPCIGADGRFGGLCPRPGEHEDDEDEAA